MNVLAFTPTRQAPAMFVVVAFGAILCVGAAAHFTSSVRPAERRGRALGDAVRLVAWPFVIVGTAVMPLWRAKSFDPPKPFYAVDAPRGWAMAVVLVGSAAAAWVVALHGSFVERGHRRRDPRAAARSALLELICSLLALASVLVTVTAGAGGLSSAFGRWMLPVVR